MPKKRVHEIAKEQGLTSKEVLQAFKDAGVYVKAASSTVEDRDIKRAFPNGARAAAKADDGASKPAPAKGEAQAGADGADGGDSAPSAVAESTKAAVPRAKATKRAKAE